MSGVNKGVVTFWIISFIISAILGNYDTNSFIMMSVSTILFVMIIKQFNIYKHIAKYTTLILIYFSVIALPSYHVVYVQNQEPSLLDYQHLTVFGTKVILVTLLSFLISSLFIRINRVTVIEYRTRYISSFAVKLFFITSYLLTLFCYAIGLGRMGQEAIVLPFHLGGIINLYREILAPALFAIIIENKLLRGVRIPQWYYVVFFIWTILETFSWMSKGILILDWIPVSSLIYFHYRPSLTKVLRYLAPFLIIFIIMYPIIAVMRHMDTTSGSLVENIVSARQESEGSDDDGGGPLLTPLNRTFMTPSKFIQDYSYINHEELFDFSKAPLIILSGGAGAYQTYTIDGYPPTAIHSSGTTGIIDPLLHGGYGLCYITIFLMMLFSASIDKSYPQRKYVIYIQLLLILVNLVITANISSLYDGLGIQKLIARLAAIILAYNLCYKRIIISSR